MVNVLKQLFESTMVHDLFYCGEAVPNLNQSSLLPKVSRIIRNYIEKLPKKNDKKNDPETKYWVAPAKFNYRI